MKSLMPNKKRRSRLYQFGFIGFVLSVVVVLVLRGLEDNIQLYLTPSQLVTKDMPIGRVFRLGGLVVPDSIHHEAKGIGVTFALSDLKSKPIVVDYQGMLPALFREGQGIVTEGYLSAPEHFHAQLVLAKHDETYRPPAVPKAKKTDWANYNKKNNNQFEFTSSMKNATKHNQDQVHQPINRTSDPAPIKGGHL